MLVRRQPCREARHGHDEANWRDPVAAMLARIPALPLSSPAMMRIGVAQFKPGKGDYTENLGQVEKLLRGLPGRQDAPELIVLPEAALTGYLLEGGVRD